MRRWELPLAILVYLLVALAFAPDAALGNGIFWFHDLRHHHYPWRVWAARQWAHLQVPWWAPGAANGFPLLAEGQGGFLYAPTMLLFLLLPGPLALNASILGHQVFGALGIHLYARARGLRGMAPFVAGIAWSWCGFQISHTLYLGMQNGLAWMGWIALATLSHRWLGVALGIGALGLAGHPQAAAFGGLILAVNAMGSLQGWDRLRWLLAAGGGAVLAAPQLLASLELSHFSMRDGGVEEGFAGIGAQPPQEMINAVLPYFFGFDRPGDVPETYYHRGPGYWGLGVNHWEMCFYLGFPMVILAVIGARRSRGWALGALLCGLLMMGGPVWGLLHHLPGFSFFRFPARFALGVSFAAAILAAEGYAEVARASRWSPLRLLRWQRHLLTAAVLFSLLTGSANLLLHAEEYQFRRILQTHFLKKLEMPEPPPVASALAAAVLPPAEPEDPDLIPLKIDRILNSLYWNSSPASPGVWWPLATLLLTAWGLGRPRYLPFLLSLDLWSLGRNYQGRVPREVVEAVPDWLVSEMTQPGGPRLTVLDRRVPATYDTQLLSASLGLLYETSDVVLPSPLLMLRNDALLAVAGLDIGDKGPVKIPRFLAHRSIAQRMGIRYIATIHEIPTLFPVVRGAVNLYVDPSALPRVRMVPCTRKVDSPDAVFAALDQEDPLKTVMVEEGEGGCVSGDAAQARLLSYAEQRVEVEATGPGTLLLADTWYPRWKATLDEAPVPILQGDLLYRAVAIPEGTHRLVFFFDPGLPGNLLWLSLSGLLGGTLWSLRSAFLRWRNNKGG